MPISRTRQRSGSYVRSSTHVTTPAVASSECQSVHTPTALTKSSSKVLRPKDYLRDAFFQEFCSSCFSQSWQISLSPLYSNRFFTFAIHRHSFSVPCWSFFSWRTRQPFVFVSNKPSAHDLPVVRPLYHGTLSTVSASTNHTSPIRLAAKNRTPTSTL